MEYRRLGKSGLQVSALSLGSWVTFGDQISDDVAEQLMPAGVLVTVPEPAPAKATVNASPPVLNMAFTVSAAVKVTVQALAPVQLPPQPLK